MEKVLRESVLGNLIAGGRESFVGATADVHATAAGVLDCTCATHGRTHALPSQPSCTYTIESSVDIRIIQLHMTDSVAQLQ